jgi:glycopeptide antibiotics resistance protein
LTTIDAGPILLPLLIAYLALIVVPVVRRRTHLTRRHPVVLTILVTYAAAVLAITVFPITLYPDEHWAGEPWWTVIHWIPFYVDAPSMVLNVIMTVPLGALLPLLWPRTGTVRRIAAWSCGASLTIELTQFVLGLTLNSRRTVDVNDLIANTAGAVLGLIMLRLAVPVFAPERASPSGLSAPGRGPDAFAAPDESAAVVEHAGDRR